MSGLSPQSDPKRISLGPGFDKSGNQARRRNGPRGGCGFDGRRDGSLISGAIRSSRWTCAAAAHNLPRAENLIAREKHADALEEAAPDRGRDRTRPARRSSRSRRDGRPGAAFWASPSGAGFAACCCRRLISTIQAGSGDMFRAPRIDQRGRDVGPLEVRVASGFTAEDFSPNAVRRNRDRERGRTRGASPSAARPLPRRRGDRPRTASTSRRSRPG